MIDDRELALKQLDFLYASEDIERSELIYEIYRLLKSGLVKYKECCENLQKVDPINNTQRFLDLVYGLYLYLHPNTITQTRCLQSEGEFGYQAARLVENRFTNRFNPFYLENSPILIRYVSLCLNPVFESDSDEKEDNAESTAESTAEATAESTAEAAAETTDPVISPDLQVVRWIIETEKEKLDKNLEYYVNPLDMFEGPTVSMFETLEKHQIESHADAFNFIHRLKSVMLEIHHVTQFMEKQKSLKSVELPKVVAQKAYDEIQEFLKTDPTKHVFVQKFQSALTNQKITEEIYKTALEFVSDSVYRSLYHLGDWIQEFFLDDDDVIPNEPNEPNETNECNENKPCLSDFSVCCDRNRGPDYYAYCLKHHTTTSMTPEEIHNLGLSEVQRISEDILQSVREYIEYIESTSEKSANVETFEQAVEYIRRITSDPTHIYSDTPEGESEVLTDIERIDQQIKSYIPNMFVEGSLPTTPCEYRFTPNHQKESMPAGYYYEPSFDGKTKGAFYTNLRSEVLRFGMPTLVAHEAIPGHHFQLSSVAESNLHPIRKIEFYNGFNAYLEGWALYTERLCREFGLFDTPLKMIGHLMDEMLRASRLVIDTGIHHYGWDRQKALSYMCEVCPFPLKNNEIEIDRYIGMPGQACSYKIGQLRIIEARDRALQSGMTLQEFNTKLISEGAIPINMI